MTGEMESLGCRVLVPCLVGGNAYDWDRRENREPRLRGRTGNWPMLEEMGHSKTRIT